MFPKLSSNALCIGLSAVLFAHLAAPRALPGGATQIALRDTLSTMAGDEHLQSVGRGPLAQPGPSCTGIMMPGGELVQDETILVEGGQPGSARLCLFRFPQTESLGAIFLGVRSTPQFRAVKAAAIARLPATGVDLCRITTWQAPGWPVALELDDLFGLPQSCSPFVVAGDEPAAELRLALEGLVEPVTAQLAREMGWQANWPILVILVTAPEAALSGSLRCVSDTPEIREALHAGHSVTIIRSMPGCGAGIVVNVQNARHGAPPLDELLSAMRAALVHEYTHIALHGLSGYSQLQLPRWYIEGLSLYLQVRVTGRPLAVVLAAVEQEQRGRAPQLKDLGSLESWTAVERGAEPNAVYSRSYAAIAYLAERYGLPALLQPLRTAQAGSYNDFLRALMALTGSDLDALDRAVGRWLIQPGRLIYRDDLADALSGWPRRAPPSDMRAGYTDQAYVMAAAPGAPAAIVWLPHPLHDFVLELDARLDPPTPGARIMLVLRAQAAGDHYSWTIGPADGSFALARVGATGAMPLVQDTPTTALVPGEHWNRFTARLSGPEIVLSINGEEVARVQDQAFQDGRVGFGVGSITGEAASVRFDNLVVRNPE